MNIRRRVLSVLATVPVASALALFPRVLRAQTTTLKPTPQDTLGPFYPPKWTGEVDADLIAFGSGTYADGTPLTISGFVRGTDGKALANARVEIWQTDATGKYRHPDDDGEGPAKRGFQGFGRTLTDTEGRYRFRTIKPVLYSGRPPHVHFRVVASGRKELVTQMYFAGDNKERSGGFGFSKERDRLTVTPIAVKTGQRDGLAAEFDLVLSVA
jgi:protocatechuate 3,4-dioxygenase beta subunit